MRDPRSARGTEPGPGRLSVSDHAYYTALTAANEILCGAERDGYWWGEEDTLHLLIHPILRMLRMPEDLVRRSVEQVTIGGRPGKADLAVGHASGRLLVLEAKAVRIDLARPGTSKGHGTPLDQGLTYLDGYGTNYCIVTNGLHWHLFARARSAAFASGPRCDYVGLSFRLNAALRDRDHSGGVRAFLELFAYETLARHVWPESTASYAPVEIERAIGSSLVLHRELVAYPAPEA